MEVLGDGATIASLDLTQGYSTANTQVSDNAGTVTIITVACFVEGTLIETVDGWIAVEDLIVGDEVQTVNGGGEPIVWIGQRDGGLRAASEAGDGVAGARAGRSVWARMGPERDLWLSPDHAVFVNEVLVPVKLLINGTSICSDETNEREVF